tara:strand:+ start:115 stop:447 length:333 start_codon:yes stop_codon:yes gene_type:complete
METILTVLSTIGVGTLAYAFAGVIRLSRRVNDLELIRMEMCDIEDKLYRHINESIQSESGERDDLCRLMAERDSSLNSHMDRRFDKVWSDIHKLDKTINPNMDSIKELTK